MIPCVGEIRMFGFNFAPVFWAPRDGRLLPINDNRGLFSLVGTTFGGNAITNLALPDLRAMVAPFQPLTFCIAMAVLSQQGRCRIRVLLETHASAKPACSGSTSLGAAGPRAMAGYSRLPQA